jgi:hypothetical protein
MRDIMNANILWVQSPTTEFVMDGIASAEDRRLIAKCGIEPWILDGFGILGE